MVKVSHEKIAPVKPHRGRYFYLWNIVDNQTRFLLANKLTLNRGYAEARSVFQEARQVARQAPSVVITDAAKAYEGAYAESVPELGKIVHLSRCSLRSGHNARIERFHGSVREREKVMRSLKHQKSGQELLNAYRVWYNYIRPHMSLGGLTPAQAAEIPLDLGQSKMLSLIRKARKP